jgi:hypothetical protein
MLPLPFHSYRLRSKKAAQTRLLNCFASVAPPEGMAPVLIQGIAGIDQFTSIAGSPQHAAISFRNELYTVAGTSLYKVSANGTVTTIGTMGPHILFSPK